MTSKTKKKINSLNILPDMSRSKCNKTIMKFGQQIESNLKIFFKNSNAENKAWRLVRASFCFFGKIHGVKTYGLRLSFSSFWLSSTWKCNKNKLHKCSICWSRYMPHFHDLGKRLAIVSPSNLVYDFSRKFFLLLYFIN